MKASELFRKYPKTPDFDHLNYRLFEKIPAIPGTLNNGGFTVNHFKKVISMAGCKDCMAYLIDNIKCKYKN